MENSNIILIIVISILVIHMCALVLELIKIQLLRKILFNISKEGESVEEENPTGILNRLKNLRMFDDLYGKSAANVDPYNEAWMGEPDNKRRKTV